MTNNNGHKNMRYSKFVFLFLANVIFVFPSNTFGFESEIAKISNDLRDQIQKSEKQRIAVVDFTGLSGRVTELGRFIAEEISTSLFSVDNTFEVIDRSHLQVILKERKLSVTGLLSPKDAQKIIKISGVDALITGNFTVFNDNIRLSIKVLDASTAKIVGVGNGNIPATKAIKDLVEKDTNTFDISDDGSDTNNIKTEFKVNSKVNKNGFLFALQGCNRKGQNVKCELLITSTDQDQHMTIYASYRENFSFFLDESGDSFYASKISIGNQQRESDVGNTFFTETPMKLILHFEKLTSAPKTASVLSIKCRVDNEIFVVNFQGVSITKS